MDTNSFTLNAGDATAVGGLLQKVKKTLTPQTACISAIIVFALILRLYFFIGFAGGDPQDDIIYLNIAKEILKNGVSDYSLQKNLLQDPIINPVNLFPSRILMTYSTALSLFLFGVNDYSAALFPLICSLLGIFVIYKTGLLLFNARVGLFAGFFLAIMPIDVVFSTRVTPDVPLAFFMMLCIYLFLKGLRTDSALLFFASGLAAGGGYLAKESAAPILVYLAFVTLVTAINKKVSPRCLLFMAGVAGVICLECLYYQILTGVPTLRFQIIPKTLKIKYTSEYNYLTLHLKWILIKYQPNNFFTHFKTLLNTSSMGSEIQLRHFGLYYYPVFIAFLWAIFSRIKERWVIISWLVILYLFLEFGPLGITVGGEPFITYELICKSSRFLTMISAPACLILALWLTYWPFRYKNIIVCIVLLVLVQTSCKNVAFSTAMYRQHTRDLREAEQYLETQPQRKIYADIWSRELLYYYSGYKLKTPMFDISDIVQKPRSPKLNDSYVILGGSRGSGLHAKYFEKNYLSLLNSIPNNWVAVKTIPGKQDSFRRRDLTIYYIP